MKNTVLLMVLCLAAFGCNGLPGTGDDAAADTIDDQGKADGIVRPGGTYVNEAAAAGQFTILVLKTNKTYHRDTMVYCIQTPCEPTVQEGTYTWSWSGSTRYIRFLDENKQLIDRYAYKLVGDDLRLRRAGESSFVTYKPAENGDAWCGIPADCTLQNLPQPRCVGQWTCSAESVCDFDCRIPCEVSGGTCVPLVPDACANGEVGDASTYSCGGGLGVQCCLPKEPENECLAAGGTCVPLVPDACANGTPSELRCGGALGVECCLPRVKPSDLCVSTGGTVVSMLCCPQDTEFTNLCGVGACACSPTWSIEVTQCRCPGTQCFLPDIGCQQRLSPPT